MIRRGWGCDGYHKLVVGGDRAVRIQRKLLLVELAQGGRATMPGKISKNLLAIRGFGVLIGGVFAVVWVNGLRAVVAGMENASGGAILG